MAEQSGTPPADESAPHILVVDDDNRLRELLRRFLSDRGYLVLEAADAAEARSRLEAFDVDLIVLDIMMPGESGLELLQELRERDDTRELPVVVVSADLLEGQREIQGSALGVVDWIEKPIDQERLVRAVRSGVRTGGRTRRARDGPRRYRSLPQARCSRTRSCADWSACAD